MVSTQIQSRCPVKINKLLINFLVILLLLPILVIAETNEDIILTVEEPLDSSVYSGVSNIRGWTVAPLGIERIELLVNGVFQTNIPSGGRRSDVGAEFPDFPNSNESGFAMAFNYSNLVEGQNIITIRAVDSNGDTNEKSVAFNVTRFENTFINDPMKINLTDVTISHNDSSIFVDNMSADGQNYDMRLDWRTATQGFAITQIKSSSLLSKLTMPVSTELANKVTSLATNESILLTIEEPLDSSVYAGVSNIRGWSIAPQGIERIELFVNGEFRGNIPSGGQRSDVGAEFTDFPNSNESGFAMAFNYSNLIEGGNIITLRAVDNNGDTNEVSVTFNTTRFNNTFINDPSKISLADAFISHNDSSIFVDNMTADGQNYDVRLDWRTATQGFAITQIAPADTAPSPSCVDIAGIWNAVETATATCMVLGQTETLTQSAMGQVDIKQDGCNISYTVPELDIPRVGTIDGDMVSYTGPLVVPFLDDVEFTKNNVSINGTVNGNRIDLTGTGEASGTVDGLPFSCEGNSMSVFTRVNTQAVKNYPNSADNTAILVQYNVTEASH